MALIEAHIIIPVRNNAGIAFSDEDWLELHQRLASVAGGFTRRGPHLGSWTDPDDGVEYTEPVFDFEVDIESWTSAGDFVDIAKWAASHFDQQAIAIKIAGVPETLSA
ncbi:MAG: hypothetical protein WD557_00190 [Dehalococcoidia bacterium]